MADSDKRGDDLVHLARLALTGRPQDVQLHVRRVAKRYRDRYPEVSQRLMELLREAPTRSSPLRRQTAKAIPVDGDSRLELIRCEVVPELDVEPILEPRVGEVLRQLVTERRRRGALERGGLTPTRSALFVGPPGVGKTLAARWLARELGLPLLTLDLSAVMSSYLGRTGNNLRHVLDYAKGTECVLLLDELDSIAKRRDDVTEVGELKRLVTVLLQEIDDWTPDGLLISATNHPGLLDPAVWRRFDVLVEFPLPDDGLVEQAIRTFLGAEANGRGAWLSALKVALRGTSFSDVERYVVRARRAAAVSEGSSETHLAGILRERIHCLPKKERAVLAAELVGSGSVTQRQAHEMTGVSRDTIRRLIGERRGGRLRQGRQGRQ